MNGTKSIIVEHKNGCAHIILDRPERLNSLSLAMIQDITRIPEESADDREGIRARLIGRDNAPRWSTIPGNS